MTAAFERFIATRDDVAGIIGAGGTGNTALVAPAMRALPVGVPKVMVSTVASGNVAQYVGASDICMMPSVTDVQGLNRISRRVLGNAAARAGRHDPLRAPPRTRRPTRPAIGLTMFGVTTTCVQQVDRAARADARLHRVPRRRHRRPRDGEADRVRACSPGAIDVTTTEVCDMMMGGVFPADETRFDAIIRTRIPYVVSCGALDMVNFGAPRHRARARIATALFMRTIRRSR